LQSFERPLSRKLPAVDEWRLVADCGHSEYGSQLGQSMLEKWKPKWKHLRQSTRAPTRKIGIVQRADPLSNGAVETPNYIRTVARCKQRHGAQHLAG
jgi:hypothetical protein